jgi:hypothetical protein
MGAWRTSGSWTTEQKTRLAEMIWGIPSPHGSVPQPRMVLMSGTCIAMKGFLQRDNNNNNNYEH